METEAPAPPQSHHGNPRAAATAVTVTAKAVTGKDVDCDFNGTDVTNNAIFVDDQASTTVTFNLVDNTGQNVQFDTSNPFGNQSGH